MANQRRLTSAATLIITKSPATGFIRSAAELLPVGFLEGIHLRADGVFVFQRWQYLAPPLIVCGAHLSHDLGMLGNDVSRFTGIVFEVIKFHIVDQVKLRVAHGAV